MNTIRSNRLLLAIAGFAFAVATHAAPGYAQSEGAAVSRADVKEQTRAANKAGQLPAGEEDTANKQLPPVSTKTREQGKAETLAANRNGGLGSPGQALYKVYNVTTKEALAHPTKTRGERKAETLQAARDHKLMPAGEVGETSVH